MEQPTPFHQLGRFVFLFQHIEATLTDLLVRMSRGDSEAVLILVNELEFGKRVKTTDVMFARHVDLLRPPQSVEKPEFHNLMVEVLKLAKRRNEIVHSKYMRWFNVDGLEGLIRYNSELSGKKGIREEVEEEMLPEKFEEDCSRCALTLMALEKFRVKLIDWEYPDAAA
ncbi:hypothetical protein [Acidovorax facilis]|jgi:hypothetical protein|uniref:hypothetical protein n=1 Tax=Acidovorax facilis TaxID=12917 RepID=UPI003D65DEEA